MFYIYIYIIQLGEKDFGEHRYNDSRNCRKKTIEERQAIESDTQKDKESGKGEKKKDILEKGRFLSPAIIHQASCRIRVSYIYLHTWIDRFMSSLTNMDRIRAFSTCLQPDVIDWQDANRRYFFSLFFERTKFIDFLRIFFFFFSLSFRTRYIFSFIESIDFFILRKTKSYKLFICK